MNGRNVQQVIEQRYAAKGLQAAETARRDDSIVVTTPRGATVLRLREIDWIEAAGNYSLVWAGSQSYLLRERLTLLEERVREQRFIRAHRRALVRLGGLRELDWSREGALVASLHSGATIRVSRRRRAAFIAAVRGLCGG